MEEQRFRKLKVWSKAMDFIEEIYKASKHFPEPEIYGLTSQLRRAAVSIAMNIAEGSGGSQSEFSRFLSISLKSSYEVICALEIAGRLNYCNDKERIYLLEQCNEVSAMIYGLKKRIAESKRHI